MYFNELRFVVFFALCWGVHWALRSNGMRKAWLLVCSYVFYAGWDWRFLGLILLSTFIDYFVGVALDREERTRRRKLLLVTSLVSNLGILGFFKYANFFVDSAQAFFGSLGLHFSTPVLQIVLPVGISFYTFQTLSYTIDVYRRRLEPIHRIGDFALFVAFFPQLVAGPIVRASTFLPQLVEPRRLADVAFRAHLSLFFLGYVKKAVVSDNFAPVIERVFSDPEAYGPLGKWLGLLMFSVQIYCDFSGYSDMAIASAGMLGYALPLNFNFPYLARTITEFWRRWHISLSTWFRDYLYIPLGGNRGSSARTYLNLSLVFFVCGLWHGASWNFVVWGLFHGAFLIFERFVRLERGLRPALLSHLYVIVVSSVAWVFFRAPDLPSSLAYAKGLVGIGAVKGGTDPIDPRWWLALAAFAIVHALMARDGVRRPLRSAPDPVFAVVYGVAVALAIPFAASEYVPFIYFQF